MCTTQSTNEYKSSSRGHVKKKETLQKSEVVTTSVKHANTKKCTHALRGLCPSKHTNDAVKGKHNNELIVVSECHNECESDYAVCF